MDVPMVDVTAAAALVGHALDVRSVPGADPDYAALLRRYRYEDRFRETVESVCVGLGLSVIEAVDQGLIVAPDNDSVFAMGSVTDFEPGLTPDQRVMTGVIHLCIAATAYPNEGDTERAMVARLRVSQIERVLRETARVVAERVTPAAPDATVAAVDAAPPASDDPLTEAGPEVFRALDLLAAMPPRKPSKKATSRRSRATTLGLIGTAFDRLVEHGCFRRASGGDDPEYLALDRYRLQVRDRALVAGHDALCEVMAAAARTVVEEPVVEEPGAAHDDCENVDTDSALATPEPAAPEHLTTEGAR